MKEVLITSGMTLKERNTKTAKVFAELEDDESFKVIEEITLEKLRDQMQGGLDALQQFNNDMKIKVERISFDYGRNLIVIEQIFTPSNENSD